MTACGWASSEWRRPMSSAAPTSAECVCTSGGRSAGAAVGNHEDAAGSGYSSVEWMESMESSRATPAQGYGCGSPAGIGGSGGGGVCSMDS